jgi:branched-chain amino acid aminotransferase
MSYTITTTLSQHSRIGSVDFDHLQFGKIFSDHMFVVDYNGQEWVNPRIQPYGPIAMSPSLMALHYGQSVFEGMKAFRRKDDTIATFRAADNAQRLNLSAERLCMPAVPIDLFMQGLDMLLAIDGKWVPRTPGGSLYIRPFMFATDEFVGVRPSTTYKFIIITGPVGPYYSQPIKLLVADHYVRAAVGGVGEAKAAGNYAASLLPAKEAQEQGFNQVMWTDAKEFKYVQEVGTMNIFFVIGDTVFTPATDGAILKGITRDSIIKILRDKGFKVEERPISIDEIMAAHVQGQLNECFGTGTAAIVAPVSEISYKGHLMQLPDIEKAPVAAYAKSALSAIRYGEAEDKWRWTRRVPELEPSLA